MPTELHLENRCPPSSIWRTDAHLEVIGQSTGQWLFVGTENKLLIEQIFGALDANKDGNINVNDFRLQPRGPPGLSFGTCCERTLMATRMA